MRNCIFHAENLALLQTLPDASIELIYIDPPFNTGNSFEHYDDAMLHEEWLRMMRERLLRMRRLLRSDGAIFVEIDGRHQAELKCLLDKVFGRQNHVTTISVRRSAPTGHKAINPAPVNVSEFIHVFARDKARWTYRPLQVPRVGYDKAYNKVLDARDVPYERWRWRSLAEVVAEDLGYGSTHEARRSLGGEAFAQAKAAFALANHERVIRTAQPNYPKVGKAAQAMIQRSKADTSRIFRLERKAHSDMYFFRGDRILFLSDKVQQIEGRSCLVEPLTNFWSDVPWQGIAGEGGVRFARSKKPEKLLQRILELSTEPGDWVLDGFLGSGTTAAVAHKLGRRWIGVELGEHARTVCLPRLEGVVEGADLTGISKQLGWAGGGGFLFCVLEEAADGGVS